MKAYVFQNPIAPFNLCTRFPAYKEWVGMSEEECLQQAIDSTQRAEIGAWEERQKQAGLSILNPPPLVIHIVDETDLVDAQGHHAQLFFDAWEWVDSRVEVNMPKARGVHMDKIREVRNKELAKKDIEFMKALEADDGSSTAIAVEKQTLRDIPQTFDLTTDIPEELKEKWPEGLPKE